MSMQTAYWRATVTAGMTLLLASLPRAHESAPALARATQDVGREAELDRCTIANLDGPFDMRYAIGSTPHPCKRQTAEIVTGVGVNIEFEAADCQVRSPRVIPDEHQGCRTQTTHVSRKRLFQQGRLNLFSCFVGSAAECEQQCQVGGCRVPWRSGSRVVLRPVSRSTESRIHVR